MLASVWGFPINDAGNICSVGANNLSERCMNKQEKCVHRTSCKPRNSEGQVSSGLGREGGHLADSSAPSLVGLIPIL